MVSSTRRPTLAGPARTRLLSSLVAVALLCLAPGAQATSYRQDIQFGSQGTGPGQFSQPQGIAIDPQDGEVFVADSNNNRVQVFTPEGTFLRQFGTLGTGPGQMSIPEGVGVSPVAPFDVYVADTNDNRVERFTNAGTFISAFGTSGAGPGQLEFPRNIAFDPQGNVYVGDTGATQRITKWASDGTFQSVIGSVARLGGLGASNAQLFASDTQANTVTRFGFDATNGGSFGATVLSSPEGVAAEPDGHTIYVGDATHHRIAVFDQTGSLSTSFGIFIDPSGLAYSSLNKRVYVVEGNNSATRVTTWQAVPDPALGKTMDIQVDTGKVLYKPPGSKTFKPLTKVTLVKSGTVIDARRGTVGITSITNNGTLQSADFYQGMFKAVQKVQGKGLTDAALFGGSFKRCPAGLRAAKHAPQAIRRLWGSGSGQFRTKGRFASAAIRGTTWLTEDRCDGTLIRVTAGAVSVQDFVKKRTILVTAGHQYFARARSR